MLQSHSDQINDIMLIRNKHNLSIYPLQYDCKAFYRSPMFLLFLPPHPTIHHSPAPSFPAGPIMQLAALAQCWRGTFTRQLSNSALKAAQAQCASVCAALCVWVWVSAHICMSVNTRKTLHFNMFLFFWVLIIFKQVRHHLLFVLFFIYMCTFILEYVFVYFSSTCVCVSFVCRCLARINNAYECLWVCVCAYITVSVELPLGIPLPFKSTEEKSLIYLNLNTPPRHQSTTWPQLSLLQSSLTSCPLVALFLTATSLLQQ